MFSKKNYRAISKTTEMKRYRQIHTVVSDTSLLSIHMSIIYDSFVTFDCIKESSEMNCRTFMPGSFCFFVKYRTIIINGVIDYRVFRYRLKYRYLIYYWPERKLYRMKNNRLIETIRVRANRNYFLQILRKLFTLLWFTI